MSGETHKVSWGENSVFTAQDGRMGRSSQGVTVSDAYVTVMDSIGGWKAVMIVRDEKDLEEPWATGIGAYGTPQEAIAEGRAWARDERIPFRSELAEHIDFIEWLKCHDERGLDPPVYYDGPLEDEDDRP